MARKYKYTLAENYVFLPAHRPAGYFCNRFLSIQRGGQIVVWRGYAHDGYSLWPDPPQDKDATAAALHDALYQWLEDIAAAFGWTVASTREWADRCFYECMILRGVPANRAAIMYRGVRWFGGIYHAVARWMRDII